MNKGAVSLLRAGIVALTVYLLGGPAWAVAGLALAVFYTNPEDQA